MAQLAVAAGRAAVRQRAPRRSRRREEVVLTEENREVGRKRIRLTTINSRRKKTRDCYKSYQNSIHEWYAINRPEICNERGELIFEKIAENCLTKAGLEEEAKQFKDFLNARTHIRKYQDAARKIPAKAGTGTLLGFRSAFNYYVWTDKENSTGVPWAWNQCFRGYFGGLKNGE